MATDPRKQSDPTALTKSELVARITEDQPELESKAVEEAVHCILERMASALAAGERIEIRGFGSMTLRYRPARIGRNPKTGEQVEVAEKYVPHFKPGARLRKRVDDGARRSGGGGSGGAGRGGAGSSSKK